MKIKKSRIAITGAALVVALLGATHAAPTPAVTPQTRLMDIAPMPSVEDIAAASGKLNRGQQLYGYWCVSCHGAGKEHPGTDALAKKYEGRLPAVLDERKDLPPNLTKYYVRQGVSIMPFFRRSEISDSDLDAIATYLARNVPGPAK
jgi:mono/diheme cytochrome c family protein